MHVTQGAGAQTGLKVMRCFIDATLGHRLGPGAPREVGWVLSSPPLFRLSRSGGLYFETAPRSGRNDDFSVCCLFDKKPKLEAIAKPLFPCVYLGRC